MSVTQTTHNDRPAKTKWAMARLAYLAGLAMGFGPMGMAVAAETAATVVFVTGQVRTTQQLKLNDPVQVGQSIQTGEDGIVYLRSVDGGFFILRPNSVGAFNAYRIGQQPGESEFRLSLTKGAGRVVSGQAAKEARDRFRFNTPVAAIGIRGTDFTVTTDSAESKVRVDEGGVVLAKLGLDCAAQALGPCVGATALTLEPQRQSAARVNLQLDQPEPINPQLVPKISSNASKPVAATAPGPATPASAPEGKASPVVDGLGELRLSLPDAPTQSPPAPIRWGRWKALASLPAEFDADALVAQGYKLVALDSNNAILKDTRNQYAIPNEGQASFVLQGHQGAFINPQTRQVSASTVQAGQLSVDFGQKTFQTALTLADSTGQTASIAGKGSLSTDGRMASAANQVTDIRGTLGGPGANQAAYLYNRQISDTLSVTGSTFWRR